MLKEVTLVSALFYLGLIIGTIVAVLSLATKQGRKEARGTFLVIAIVLIVAAGIARYLGLG